MHLASYVTTVQEGLTSAAVLADEPTQAVARRLATAVEPSTRLALIQALSDAAASLSADLAPSSVELRLAGGEPEFVVTVSSATGQPTVFSAQEDMDPAPDGSIPGEDGEEETARISLRLPASVKAAVDALADEERISTNSWLQRVILDAIAERRSGSGRRDATGRLGDFVPFGPHGVFGPHGPFGPHGLFGRGGAAPMPPVPPAAPEAPRHGHHVQGWAR